MNILCLADTAPQPWANGGGVTRELLAWPSPGAWQVRVSVADIAQDGPFSSYPGVTRWFAVLEGAGVLLHLPAGIRRLTPADAPLCFDGADAPGCTLLDGRPTRDFNLMLRGVDSAGLQPATAADWVSPRAHRAVFTTGAATLHTPQGAHALPAMSLAWLADAAHQRWRLAGQGQAWWLDWGGAGA